MNDKTEKVIPHQIKKNRQFIKGSSQNKFGVLADYSQATFVMNDNEFDEGLDKLLSEECSPNDIIYLFYGHLYPYIEAALDDNHKLYSRSLQVQEDAQETVNMYAKLKFELDIALEFIESKGLKRDFTGVLKSKNNKLKKDVAKVIEDSQLKLL